LIGLISAIEEELTRFKEQAAIAEVVSQAGLEFHLGRLEGCDIILLRSGVGKVNAAVATQLLIDRFGARAVVFTGLAGTLVPYLKRGDVVISNFAVQHDIDLTAFGRRPGQLSDTARQIEADPALIAAASEAYDQVAEAHGLTSQMVVGTLATGDSFISDPSKIRWLQREFGAVAADMEGGAVGQVCAMNRVPFVIIRVISDTAGGEAAGQFITFLDQASELTFEITAALLKRLAEPAKPADRAH
jgi:adenosylhomocysteine nucleosidase